jgi:hypothetical protein
LSFARPRQSALTPPHSSIKHRRLGSTSFREQPMKRLYENQIAAIFQPVLDERDRMEG